MKIITTITIRTKSTRLPLKVLRLIEGKTVIEHMIERLKMSTLPDEIILCTSINPQDDVLVDVAEETGIKYFRGSELDVLDRLAESRGLPETITMDNGPEFAGRALDEWAYSRGVKLSFIRPGKPTENAFAESFIGKFRDECLNMNWFMNLKHVGEIIEAWRIDYNEVRPHRSLKGSTPKEYAEVMAGL